MALSAASVLLARRVYVLLPLVNPDCLPDLDVHAGARRIAIWKKNRVVVAIAMSLWLVNDAFIIQGNSTPFPPSMIWNSCQAAFISHLTGT
jgi:hypothetical protein